MLIPSIDLMNGKIVQLRQGAELKLSFDDFDFWINKFSKYPLVQLIDLDAAMRKGDNRALIHDIAKRLPVQVGGGIRTADDARALLDSGAKRVIFGSSLFNTEPDAKPDQLIRKDFAASLQKEVGEENLVFSVDTKNGKVAVRGWQANVDLTPEEAITWLEPYCAAFLYTHVDTEGTMQGFPIDTAAILRATTTKQLIVAGGIRSKQEVDDLDAFGVDAVVGMAVYSGAMEA